MMTLNYKALEGRWGWSYRQVIRVVNHALATIPDFQPAVRVSRKSNEFTPEQADAMKTHWLKGETAPKPDAKGRGIVPMKTLREAKRRAGKVGAR